MEDRKWMPSEALPCNLSKYTETTRNGIKGDIYVSAKAKDGEDGSIQKPYSTLGKALSRARELHKNEKDRQIVISLLDGDYYCNNSIVLTAEDSHTTISVYNDNGVSFTGGKQLSSDSFEAVIQNVDTYFPEEALGKIYKFDMKKAGLSSDDWGKIYASGGIIRNGNPEWWNGKKSEVFFNGKRLELPRFPELDFIPIEKVLDAANKVEIVDATTPGIICTKNVPSTSTFKGLGGTFEIAMDYIDEVKSWQNYDNLWVQGYFSVDWSNSLVPIENINFNNNTLTTALSDSWGMAEGGYYYFLNVPQRMNKPGLYYIDYDNGILYICPDSDIKQANVQISVFNEPFIIIDNADNIIIDGIEFTMSKSCAIQATGNNINIHKCKFKNLYETAIRIEGIRNTINECEFAHLAKSGADMIAGDKASLTPGYAVFDNNVVHDYGEIDKSGVHAVSIVGVHNRVSHNEFYSTPYNVIHYSGQDHLIEYNYAHEVVQNTGDMGTTYSGFHWDSQGCVLRYNCFCNIGNEKFGSNGIYWDDMLGGQTGYGNIIINAGGHGFIIGGGRDHLNYNNIVINCGGYPLLYDQRGCEWEKDFAMNMDSGIWQNLKSMPYTSEKWAKKFPALARITLEPDFTNPNFPPLPANSRVTGNVYISILKPLVMDKVRQYSIVGNNVELDIDDDAGFVDRAGGNYNFREDSVVFEQLPAFENLPFEKIGRY